MGCTIVGASGASLERCAVAVALTLAVVGCVDSRAPVARGPEDTSLTILYPGDERILSPYWEMPAKFLMFEPLVRLGEGGEPEGRLAESWEWSDDGASLLVHLRPRVTWHDGTPFTAHDIAFTYRLWMHEEVLRIPPGMVEVEVIDDLTARITSTSVRVNPLSTWDVYYPRHLLQDLDPAQFDSWEFWIQPVGNGPYRYVRHLPKTMMEFEAYPAYYDGRPRIDRLVLKFGSGGMSRITELLSGEVDAIGWALPDELRLLDEDPRYEAYHQFNTAYRAIVWNARLARFADPRVRRALTHALDRPAILAARDIPATAPLLDTPPLSDVLAERAPLALPHDRERARLLLEEAGWNDGDGGVRHRDGQPLAFTLTTAAEDQATAVLVQEQLGRVGVDVRLEVLNRVLVRRKWRDADFQAILMILSNERIGSLFGADGTSGYADPFVAGRIAAADAASTRERRREILAGLEQAFLRDQPATVLYPGIEFFIVPAWLEGLSSPHRADPLVYADRLSVDAEEHGGH